MHEFWFNVYKMKKKEEKNGEMNQKEFFVTFYFDVQREMAISLEFEFSKLT